MEIELELDTKLTDVSEVIELEIESSGNDDDKYKDDI